MECSQLLSISTSIASIASITSRTWDLCSTRTVKYGDQSVLLYTGFALCFLKWIALTYIYFHLWSPCICCWSTQVSALQSNCHISIPACLAVPFLGPESIKDWSPGWRYQFSDATVPQVCDQINVIYSFFTHILSISYRMISRFFPQFRLKSPDGRTNEIVYRDV